MNLLTIGRPQPSSPNGPLCCEVAFDGRRIGVYHPGENGQGHLEILVDACPEDVLQARTLARNEGGSGSLQGYVGTLFQVIQARDTSLRKMRQRLKRNTLFATPGRNVQMVSTPYCERVRASIKQRYPEAVILNTLSEDEALRHFTATAA